MFQLLLPVHLDTLIQSKLSLVNNYNVVTMSCHFLLQWFQEYSNHLTYFADIIERVGWVSKVMCTASELCYWR